MVPQPTSSAQSMEDLALVRRRYLSGDAAPTGVRPVVLESWERARRYGVSPYDMPVQNVDDAALALARSGSQRLMHSAAPFLELMHETLRDQPHLIALSDSSGVILQIYLSPDLAPDALTRANLFEGASWHERD